MSASQNVESMINQGEFSSRVPPSEPLTTKGVSFYHDESKYRQPRLILSLQHKPGVKVGNDAAPEFSAEAHPPGTAPRESTFTPNAQSEIPSQAHNPDPLDFPGAATSGSVHSATEFGKPLDGQTGGAEHHGSRKKDRVAVGAGGAETGDGSVDRKVRGLGADLEGRAGELKGLKGASGAVEGGSDWTGAEERIPTSAEELSAELPKGGHSGVASSERAAAEGRSQ